MSNRGKKRRHKVNNMGEIIASLNFSEYTPFPKHLYGIKALIQDKDKGINMIQTIMERFYISDFDIEDWRRQMKEKEKENFKEMEEDAKKWNGNKIDWTRDEKGNIISPFKSKKIT